MEQFIIQNPILVQVTWVLLNVLHYLVSLFSWRLFKKHLPQSDPAYNIKNAWKSLIRVFLWTAFGALMFWGAQKVILQKESAVYTYFVELGVFFSIVIGYLLINGQFLIEYIIYKNEISQFQFGKYGSNLLSLALPFFSYAFLMLLSFLVIQNPFLLGGTLGFALGGVNYILNWTEYRYSNRRKKGGHSSF